MNKTTISFLFSVYYASNNALITILCNRYFIRYIILKKKIPPLSNPNWKQEIIFTIIHTIDQIDLFR